MERHLRGEPARRLPLLGQSPKRIGIKISGRFAASRSGQALLWALCNLACRLKGVVSDVEVCVPAGAAVAAPDMIRPGPVVRKPVRVAEPRARRPLERL